MKKEVVFCGMALLASLGSAHALESQPLGEWVVQEGVARIRIVDCNSRLWGVVSWEKIPGNVDAQNPDRSKRTRPTLGMPVLLNMKKAPAENKGDPEEWEGKVYNAKNGKTYESTIRLTTPDKLEIKGCVLGFLCGGETWTRYLDPAAQLTPAPAPAAPPKSTAAQTKAKSPPGSRNDEGNRPRRPGCGGLFTSRDRGDAPLGPAGTARPPQGW